MGSATSKLVDQEKSSWVNDHSLNYDIKLRGQYRDLLSNFKDGCDLHLCYVNKIMVGYPYQHWFVTDGTWVIEFGSGDVLDNVVVVHALLRKGYITAESFKMNNDVRNRMLQVCGASNYSLALRNCEHVARYIQSGVWVSFQMAKGSGALFKIFVNYLSNQSKLVNTFPSELTLTPSVPEKTKLYNGYKSPFEYRKSKQVLTEADNDSYNVVFLGPTGCGKSTLINNLFNLTVVNAAASAESVTRRVEFAEGEYQWTQTKTGLKTEKRIIAIDTLGFCDSVFTANQVLAMIKTSLELNLAKIDKVVIVCSGRIEKQHAEAIKQFMGWLQYEKYKKRFCFVYNKSDGLSEAEKVTCLLKMCELLGADTADDSFVSSGEDKTVFKQNVTLGFPSNASFTEIEGDLKKFHKVVSANKPSYPRISLDKSSCTIL